MAPDALLIRFAQWWMLLLALLWILSGQPSLVGMKRLAKRPRQMHNKLLGSVFRQVTIRFPLLLAAQLVVPVLKS